MALHRLEPQTADRGINSQNPDPYRPNPWQRCEISCPVEGMGPHRMDCIYQDPRGFGQATAQQRTSRLRVNLCLSITQAAGLVPPLNGQGKKPQKIHRWENIQVVTILYAELTHPKRG